MSERKPDFFILGAPKAATTSLYMYLTGVDAIFLPEKVKEPHFFSVSTFEDSNPRVIRDPAKYHALFSPARADQLAGEASASYLGDEQAAALIKAYKPDARLIAIIRDPVERAFSHYLMNYKRGRTTRSFFDELQIELGRQQAPEGWKTSMSLHNGFYFKNLSRYYSQFNHEQLLVLVFEEFTKDIPGGVRQVLEFLGIDGDKTPQVSKNYNSFSVSRGRLASYILDNDLIKRMARTVVPFGVRDYIVEKILTKKSEKPALDDASRDLLAGWYRDDVEKLAGLIERRPPFKNFN